VLKNLWGSYRNGGWRAARARNAAGPLKKQALHTRKGEGEGARRRRRRGRKRKGGGTETDKTKLAGSSSAAGILQQ